MCHLMLSALPLIHLLSQKACGYESESCPKIEHKCLGKGQSSATKDVKQWWNRSHEKNIVSTTPVFISVPGNGYSIWEKYWCVTDFIKSETCTVPDLLGHIYWLAPNSKHAA